MMLLTLALMLTFAALVIVSQPSGAQVAEPAPVVYDRSAIVVEGALP